MPIRIIVNDKECTSKIVKFGIGVTVLVGTIAIAALIIFVLLPIIGVSVAATIGLIIVVTVGIFAAAVALTLGGVILGNMLVLIDYIAGKFRHH